MYNQHAVVAAAGKEVRLEWNCGEILRKKNSQVATPEIPTVLNKVESITLLQQSGNTQVSSGA